MDGLSSTEFAFVAALYLFAPNSLQAQNGDFSQMWRAASPGEARLSIRHADEMARLGANSSMSLAQAAAARRRKLEAEREAYAAMTAASRRPRPDAMAARLAVPTEAQPMSTGQRLVTASTDAAR